MSIFGETFDKGLQQSLDRSRRQAGRDMGNWAGSIITGTTNGFAAQGNYNQRRQQGYVQEAGRIGQSHGRNQAFGDFGGMQTEYDRGFVQGAGSAARRAGRYDADSAFGGQSGGQRAPRYNDNGRYGNQHYRDDAGHHASSSHSGPQDRFMVSDGKFTFQIDNNGVPLTREQQQNIGAALADIQSWGGKDEAGALRVALQNGLSPDARIVSSHGRAKSGVDVETFVRQGMTGGDQKNALEILDGARDNPLYQHRPQAAQGQSSGRVNEWQFEGNQQAMLQPNYAGSHRLNGDPKLSDLSELINSQTVTRNGNDMTAYERLMAIQEAAKVGNSAQAQQFNRELAQNQNVAANYTALVQAAGRDAKTPEERNAVQGAALSFMKASSDAKHFDPSGHDASAARIMNGGGNNPNAAAVRQQANNTPSTNELAQVTIADADLQRRLQTAVGEQRKMDEMCKNNPLLGMFMTLLRPLFNAMNPDSDPMNIIAEAKAKGVAIDGPEQVLAKVEGRAVNPAAIAQNTGARSAEQGEGTSPAVTAAAPLPEGGVGQGGPTGPRAEQLAAQGKAQAETNQLPQAIDTDKLFAQLNEQDVRVQAQIRNDLKGSGVDISRIGNGFTKEEVAAVASAIQEGHLTAQDLSQITNMAIAQKGAFIADVPNYKAEGALTADKVKGIEEAILTIKDPYGSDVYAGVVKADGILTNQEANIIQQLAPSLNRSQAVLENERSPEMVRVSGDILAAAAALKNAGASAAQEASRAEAVTATAGAGQVARAQATGVDI